ncbi:MAG: membrane associated rhomboid family serine protease [Flavobacteriales bacterium]|jgi:membrane associated rhomboid family serine protease
MTSSPTQAASALPPYKVPIALASVMVIIYLCNWLPFIDLYGYGIHPRSLSGLYGIAVSFLLHASLFHLISNLVPMVVLGSLLHMYGSKIFWQASIIIVLVSGIGVWLFSSAGTVVGASGLLMGYWSFMIAVAYHRRTIKSVVIAFAVLLFYGLSILSLFDLRPYISFSAHLFGFVGGVMAYYLIKNQFTKASP